MTFINKSGASVIGFLNFYKLQINDIVVIQDQIVIRARDAAHVVLCKGAKEAMNLFNKKVMI